MAIAGLAEFLVVPQRPTGERAASVATHAWNLTAIAAVVIKQ